MHVFTFNTMIDTAMCIDVELAGIFISTQLFVWVMSKNVSPTILFSLLKNETFTQLFML